MAASPTCPKCARQLPADATECPFDGTKLQVFNPTGDDAAWTENTATRRASSEDATFFDPAMMAPAAAEDEKADPLVGSTLGDYVIGKQLGRGAMGIVYAGEQPLIGKKVAIKVLRPEVASDENQVSRLLAEARAVNAIRHRGIIDIFNFGKLPDGRHYVVMELLAGEPMDVMLHRRGPLTPLEVIGFVDEICSALGAGHGAGIIHRDLKPSNIFVVSESNGSKYLKILDFGLAKHGETHKGRALTQANLVVGTPEYMAPEQARADGVTAQSDLYSVGIIAFELLTGRLPFEAQSAFEYMIHQVQTPPPRPSTMIGGIPADLEALVMQLLEKDPGKRPATTEHVRRELNRIKRAMASTSTVVGDAATPASPSRPSAGSSGPRDAPPRASTGNSAARGASGADAPTRPSTGPRSIPNGTPRAASTGDIGDATAPRMAMSSSGARSAPKSGARASEKTIPADAEVPSISSPSIVVQSESTAPEAARGTEKLAPLVPRKRSPWPALALGSFVLCAGAAALIAYKRHASVPEVQPLQDAVAVTGTVALPTNVEPEKVETQKQLPEKQEEPPKKLDPPPDLGGTDNTAKLTKTEPKDSGPTRVALLGDITRMEKRAQASPQKLTVSPSLARAMLAQLKHQAQSASSPDDRKRVSRNVREAEKKIFAR